MPHLTITLNNSSESKIILPRSYQHQLQAMIYQLPSSQYADFLHNTGFSPNTNKNTKYKMFSFSRLIPNRRPKQIEDNKIELSLPIRLVISTPKEEIAEESPESLVSEEAESVLTDVEEPKESESSEEIKEEISEESSESLVGEEAESTLIDTDEVKTKESE